MWTFVSSSAPGPPQRILQAAGAERVPASQPPGDASAPHQGGARGPQDLGERLKGPLALVGV